MTTKQLISRALCALIVISVGIQAKNAQTRYTVNGQPVASEMQQLLSFHGFKPGDYYIDTAGNYGNKGSPPSGNIDGGPVRNWRGEPKSVADNAYAQAYVNGIAGVRVFWVYSPSIFSGATGGASGYYHLCPNNRYFRSSEGAINVGGDYNAQTGQNNAWGGVAGTHQGGGRWSVNPSANGPLLQLSGSDGSHSVLLSTLLQGSWKMGQTKYAAEPGKASCP